MFKTGDKVVCINSVVYNDVNLVLHNTYVICETFNFNGVNIIVDGRKIALSGDRFKLLSDFRKQKIEKICSKLEIG